MMQSNAGWCPLQIIRLNSACRSKKQSINVNVKGFYPILNTFSGFWLIV